MTLRKMLTLAFAFSFAAVVGSAQATNAQTTPTPNQKKVQKVKLSYDGKSYVVTPSTLINGVPVEMDVDLDSVKGCLRTVVIATLKVKKTVKTGDTIIEFTPDKTGSVPVICGMNMGKGAFTVVDPK